MHEERGKWRLETHRAGAHEMLLKSRMTARGWLKTAPTKKSWIEVGEDEARAKLKSGGEGIGGRSGVQAGTDCEVRATGEKASRRGPGDSCLAQKIVGDCEALRLRAQALR